jgi:hypothetical protein
VSISTGHFFFFGNDNISATTVLLKQKREAPAASIAWTFLLVAMAVAGD